MAKVSKDSRWRFKTARRVFYNARLIMLICLSVCLELQNKFPLSFYCLLFFSFRGKNGKKPRN